MIDAIDLKKKIILVVMLLACLLLAGAHYLYFSSAIEEKTSQINTMTSQISEVQTDIDKIKQEITSLEEQKTLFNKISKTGFLNNQDRLTARSMFDILQRQSKVISMKYEIKAASIKADDLSQNTGFIRMETPISVELNAIDDLDVFRFIYYLNYGFPGNIEIQSLEISRNGVVDADVLKSIGNKTYPNLVNGKMDLLWTTMTKKDSIPAQYLQENDDSVSLEGTAQ